MNPRTRCRHCGYRFEDHGGKDNPHRPYACPASDKFPPFPSAYAKKHGEQAAGALLDKRLVKHWTARSTSFEAMT